MTFLGIDYAPLNVPFERRLQTFGTVIFVFCALLLGPVSTILSIYLLLFTRYYWIVLIYICYRYFDGHPEKTGSRSTHFVRNLAIWRWYRDYLPMKLIKTAELEPSKNYLLAIFPHGFMAFGCSLGFGTEALNVGKEFPGIRLSTITLDANFKMPGTRELFLSIGSCSASKESLNYLLSDPDGGRAAVLVVGGAAEALFSRPGNYKIVLKKRMGFVKLALKNGASLVPVLSFGETELYDQVANPEGSLIRTFQEYIKKYTGISPIFFLGRGLFQYTYGLLPRRRPVNIVVGKPIDVMKVLDPSETQIRELHQRFMTELTELFEDKKHEYLENAENISLEIE